jgi:phosphoribosyl 1,2-cyclic phosphate phosphodiesterase
MRLFFLGTAAAEGYPGIFCDCPNCRKARTLGGRNIRLRSALLVNDNLLIDFGPDILASALRFNLNLSSVATALVTHAHMDHFFLGNAEMRARGFTGGLEIPTLRMFGPQDVTGILNSAYPDLSRLRMEAHTVHAFDTWQADGYTIKAYQAYHAVGLLETLFYSIDDGQHAFLYATDTGPFPAETWQALEGETFDAIILEETMGTGLYNQHIGFDDFIDHAQRMRAMGLLRPGGRIIAHHMSHSANPSHEEIENIFGPHEVQVAFDGLSIDL